MHKLNEVKLSNDLGLTEAILVYLIPSSLLVLNIKSLERKEKKKNSGKEK